MQYLDFEVEIGAAADGGYAVRVLRSPAGEATGTMRLSVENLQLGDRIEALQTALLRSGVSGHAPASPEAGTVEEFGRELWAALFTGDVLATFEVSRREARQAGGGMRLKLRVAPPELAALPWEYLFDTRRGDYLAVSSATPLVRYVPLQQAIEPLSVTPPLRILAMIASPSDYPALDVERERGRLERAIGKLQERGLVELTWLDGQTPHDLLDALQHPPWHVFHFIGHGGFDPDVGQGVIVFADDTGTSRRVASTDLGRLLGDHEPLRLAVLNSCDSARGDAADVFSSTAATLVRRGTPAVVAMQYEITDEAAIEFSRSFYNAIAAGIPVDAAVAEARKGIALAIPNTLEWGTPVLFMRAPDGVLFSVPAAPVAPTTPPPDIEPEPEPRREPEPEPQPIREREPEPEPEPQPIREREPEPEPEPQPIREREPGPPRPLPPRPRPPRPRPGRPTPGGPRWGRRLAVALGGLAALVVIGAVIASLDQPLPGRIAYGTESGIVTVAPTGADAQLLPGSEPGDADPSWSPDGSSVVMHSPAGLRILAFTDAGFGGPLTDGPNDVSPAWSPDGGTIAYASDIAGGPLQIFVVDVVAGAEPRRVGQSGVEEHDPEWSPDGALLAFVAGSGEAREIVVYDIAADAFTQITSNGSNDVDPAWSPDGQSIAFASTRDGNFDIWKMNVNGGEAVQLTAGAGVDNDPAWSPDGRAIVFSRSEGGAPQLWVLMLETGQEIQITSGGGSAIHPSWR